MFWITFTVLVDMLKKGECKLGKKYVLSGPATLPANSAWEVVVVQDRSRTWYMPQGISYQGSNKVSPSKTAFECVYDCRIPFLLLFIWEILPTHCTGHCTRRPNIVTLRRWLSLTAGDYLLEIREIYFNPDPGGGLTNQHAQQALTLIKCQSGRVYKFHNSSRFGEAPDWKWSRLDGPEQCR